MRDFFFYTLEVVVLVGVVVAIIGMLSTFPLTRQQRRIAKLEAERKEKWLREDLLKEDLLLKKLQDGFSYKATTYNTDGTGHQPDRKALHPELHKMRIFPRI